MKTIKSEYTGEIVKVVDREHPCSRCGDTVVVETMLDKFDDGSYGQWVDRVINIKNGKRAVTAIWKNKNKTMKPLYDYGYICDKCAKKQEAA